MCNLIPLQARRRSSGRTSCIAALLCAALVFCLGPGARAQAQAAPQSALPGGTLSARVIAQIQSLEQEKNARTPAQRKLDSQLWYANKMSLGLEITREVPTLRSSIKPDADGLILVDITADVSDELLGVIKSAGGVVVNAFPQYRAIRARLPLRQMEYVAGQPGVQFIKPAVIGRPQGNPTAMFQSRGSKFLLAPFLLPELKSGFGTRAGVLRAGLPALLHKLNPLVTPNTGSVDSEGDTTHRAITARSTYKVDGTGIKIGVMSDSDDFLSNSQASGDLPANVTTLSGQSGSPGSGEGTAMMEIVHDIAPGAQIYFATGNSGAAQFAANIIALHNAGCQIIVDDISYDDESPFQDSTIAQAVDTVTAAGALYFSCATNYGNLTSQLSGCWEGTYVASANTYNGLQVLNFATDGTDHNVDYVGDFSGGNGQDTTLFWDDPLGKSANDYDLYELDSNAANVVSSSTNTQNGTQDPFENIPNVANADYLLVALSSGAVRFLHLDMNSQNGALAWSTAGRTRGHNSVNAVGAYGVAATPATKAQGKGEPAGPYPNAFNTSNVVEQFSSDGPRRQFYDKNGTAITPTNLTATGGVLLKKPDITAADGVTTSLNQTTVGTGKESFSPFFGTSAAAPHAAALTALLLSYAPTLTQAQVRTILTGHSIDIMTAGWDRDSGYGILDAVNMLAAAPTTTVALSSVALSPTSVVGGQANATGTVTLTAAATAATTVTLASNNTAALTVPASVTVAAGATTATFTATSKAVTAATSVTVTAAYNSVSKTAAETVNPPSTTGVVPVSFVFNPNPAYSSGESVGTVTLSGAAPTGGAVVSISYNGTAFTTVTVAAGQTTGTVSVVWPTVTTATTYTMGATYNGTTVNTSVTVNPTSVSIVSLSYSPSTVTGGSSSTGTVTLSAAAPAGGAYVTLTNPDATTSALLVPAGQTSAAYTQTTPTVTTSTTYTYSAAYNGGTVTGTLTAVPASTVALSSVALSPTSVVGGQANATGTVTLTAAATAATSVTLMSSNTAALTVPASVSVAAGATTATFTATSKAVTAATSVTVTAAYNSISKTAAETVNPATTVALTSLVLSPTSVVGGQANATGTVTLSAAATAATTVFLGSSDSTVLAVPSSVTVAAGATSATFTATSFAVTATTTEAVAASYSSVTKTVTETVTPAALDLSSVTLSPTSVIGGQANATGTVTLTAAATAATTVTLTSSNTAALTVPASVTVAAGAKTATFTATSKAVTAATSVTVTAAYNSISKTATETVSPATSTAALSTVTFSPTSVIGGAANSTGTVTLTAAVTAAKAVTLTSSNTAALTVPASVTVAAGAKTATFTATSHAVTTAVNVTITGTLAGVSKTGTVTVTPAPGTVKSMTFNPNPAYSSGKVIGTVTLTSAAPTGGKIVTINKVVGTTSTVLLKVTVPAGVVSATFSQIMPTITSATTLTYSAVAGTTVTTVLNVNPTTVALTALTMTPNPVSSGSTFTGKVTLSAAAPAGGAAVTISQAGKALGSVTIPAGVTTASFGLFAPSVTTSTTYAYAAAYNGVTQTANLVVNP